MSGQPKITNRSAQNSSNIISSIYKSRSTMLEQLRDQNYNIDEYNGFTVNEVNSMSQNSQLDMLLEKNDPDETGRKRKRKSDFIIEKICSSTTTAQLCYVKELFLTISE